MHVADLLSRRSDHYVSSGDDNKDQVLLNPVTIKLIDVTDRTYEERQSLITGFMIPLLLDIRVSKPHIMDLGNIIYGMG